MAPPERFWLESEPRNECLWLYIQCPCQQHKSLRLSFLASIQSNEDIDHHEWWEKTRRGHGALHHSENGQRLAETASKDTSELAKTREIERECDGFHGRWGNQISLDMKVRLKWKIFHAEWQPCLETPSLQLRLWNTRYWMVLSVAKQSK